jgi:hypothetical protein
MSHTSEGAERLARALNGIVAKRGFEDIEAVATPYHWHEAVVVTMAKWNAIDMLAYLRGSFIRQP